MQDELNFEREKINAVDSKIAELFSERMACVENIARIKAKNCMSAFDPKRENEILENELALVAPELRAYYKKVISCLMNVSKLYQNDISKGANDISVTTDLGSYDIKFKKSSLSKIGEFFDLDRKVLVVTDDGVPENYSKTVASECKTAVVVTLPQGESAKSPDTFFKLQRTMIESKFDRNDCVVAVGGGVVGDVAGFVASCYMRGIDFYNVPTTLLSQVDSSIGGKTAVNFADVKNSIGAFKQPKAVLIDTSLLYTLDKRQLSNGLFESIKMSLTCDRELFEMIESGVTKDNLDEIIRRSLIIKKSIVELDEREHGLRRVLNFGHTIGHAIEIHSSLLHGECVALGMLPMVSDSVRKRLIPIYKRLGLCAECEITDDFAFSLSHDKKSESGYINIVKVKNIGEFEFVKLSPDEIETMARQVLTNE